MTRGVPRSPSPDNGLTPSPRKCQNRVTRCVNPPRCRGADGPSPCLLTTDNRNPDPRDFDTIHDCQSEGYPHAG
jgi:hypothetical protein